MSNIEVHFLVEKPLQDHNFAWLEDYFKIKVLKYTKGAANNKLAYEIITNKKKCFSVKWVFCLLLHRNKKSTLHFYS